MPTLRTSAALEQPGPAQLDQDPVEEVRGILCAEAISSAFTVH